MKRQMRIASVDDNTLNSVSSSAAGALDIMKCDFSTRSARDGMRRIIGSSEPDVIMGSDKRPEQRMQEEGQRSHGILV